MKLRIDSLAKGGEAVARDAQGRVVFVDGGVPGDLVEVELTDQKAKMARARVIAVLERGAARVDPPCPYALTCGGCPWQIVSDEAQHAAKQEIVVRALRRLGIVPEPLLVAPAALGYRARATMYARSGQIGFYARRSHALVPIERCLALEPGLDEAMRRARAEPGLARALGEQGALRGTIGPSGQVQLAFELGRGAEPAVLDELAARFVESKLAVGVLRGPRAFGLPLLDAGEGDRPFFVSAAGFRQANEAQNQVLRRLVREELCADGLRLVELYAGDGNFTRDQLGAAHVLAIEEDAAAIARLRRSLPTVEAVAARAEHELRRRTARGERYDRLLLDPPRAGAKELVPGILALQPARVVYVSCDPATLARDLEALVAGGYRLTRIVPVDLMPHTDHVEVVATLAR